MEDSGSHELAYVREQLSMAWKGLRAVQKNAKEHMETHMTQLADHYAEKRDSTRVIEVKKIHTSERTRRTAAKHKWYLKERHGMIRNLLVPDYRLQYILSIMGVIAFTIMVHQLMAEEGRYCQPILIASGAWGISTV